MHQPRCRAPGIDSSRHPLHQPAADTLTESSAPIPKQHLVLSPSNPLLIGEPTSQLAGEYPVTMDQVPDPTLTSDFLANSHHNVINNPTMVSVTNTFETGGGAIMQLLETKTIEGAEHDSSARYPPPRCHPETRKVLREEISDWVTNPMRGWRMFYVLGTAGVGKSAVAQTIADECEEAGCLGACCFISRPNHRNNPDGVIPTLVYQLAVKCDVYKRIISQKIAHDPTILRKARRVQFKELLIDPFRIIMTQDPSAIQKPLLIIIDGLDECESLGAQCEFIELIGNHVRSFPEFPLLWLICSRPESHLKYTLSQADFQVTCRREEISVDDEEGKRDVLLYLRSQFRNIRLKYSSSLYHNWPPEVQLLRIATAASGLFAFASTIVRFVDDAEAGDPLSQLQICMRALEGSSMAGAGNPYLTLDFLYRHILASIPSKFLSTTMRILGMSIYYPHYANGPSQSARCQANFLRIGRAAFDHALKQLHSVLRIDSSSDAFESPIEFYHASFGDFLKDPARSGEYCLDKDAIHYDVALTALSWHIDLTRGIQEGDMWLSSEENVQTCLENVKSQSLVVLWRACSRVQEENAIHLYQNLHRFDFNALDSDVPAEWEFGRFLSWLDLQDRGSSSPKLLNSLCLYQDCDEVEITNLIIRRGNILGCNSERCQHPTNHHLDLGNGSKRRHIHITTPQHRRPVLSDEEYLTPSSSSRHTETPSLDELPVLPQPEVPRDPPPLAVKPGWRQYLSKWRPRFGKRKG